jgi:hypothetical protein
MRLLAALATMTTLAMATPALAVPPIPQRAADRAVIRVADLERAPARKARAHRHYGHAPARGSWVVITSGHPLSRFPGEIQYRYLPGSYCCCCRGR